MRFILTINPAHIFTPITIPPFNWCAGSRKPIIPSRNDDSPIVVCPTLKINTGERHSTGKTSGLFKSSGSFLAHFCSAVAMIGLLMLASESLTVLSKFKVNTISVLYQAIWITAYLTKYMIIAISVHKRR